MIFIILVSIVFFSEWCEYFLQIAEILVKVIYHLKSFNHKCIKVCSSMKVSLLYIYELIIILFHLQIMSILYFTYTTVCSPTRSSVSCCVNNSNAYHSIYTMALILISFIFIIIRMYFLTDLFQHLGIQMRMRN